MPVIVVGVMSGWWWHGDEASYCINSSVDRSAERCTMTARGCSPIAAPLPQPMRPSPIIRWTGSYRLVQPDKPKIGPAVAAIWPSLC